MDYIGESVTSVTSVTGPDSTPHHGETVIIEWHRDDDRTFTIEEVRRWFKVATPLAKANLDRNCTLEQAQQAVREYANEHYYAVPLPPWV